MSGIGNCFKDSDTGLPITQFLSDLRWQQCTAQRYEVFKHQKKIKISKHSNLMRRCCNQSNTMTDIHFGFNHTGVNSDDMIQQQTRSTEVVYCLKMDRRSAAHSQN
jgi:hypothetical protein